MEPLADAERRRVIGERASRPFRRAVFPHEPHVEMPVIRGSLRLLVAGRRGPSLRPNEKGVPKEARAAAHQPIRGAGEDAVPPPLLRQTRTAPPRPPHPPEGPR